MGTHPIFESDFDCLTDLSEWVGRDLGPDGGRAGGLGLAGRALGRVVLIRLLVGANILLMTFTTKLSTEVPLGGTKVHPENKCLKSRLRWRKWDHPK